MISYLLDESIGVSLDLFFMPFAVVFGDFAVLLELLECLQPIVSRVPDAYPALFGEAMSDLGQFVSTLTAQVRQRKANHVSVY